MKDEKYIDRSCDDDIIDIVRKILSNSVWEIETINEAVLSKLMSLRGTPIKHDKTLRNIDKDYKEWKKYN